MFHESSITSLGRQESVDSVSVHLTVSYERRGQGRLHIFDYRSLRRPQNLWTLIRQ